VVALIVLVSMKIESGKTRHLVGFVAFRTSMAALYTASAVYHILPIPPWASGAGGGFII
jgi:hemolysin III